MISDSNYPIIRKSSFYTASCPAFCWPAQRLVVMLLAVALVAAPGLNTWAADEAKTALPRTTAPDAGKGSGPSFHYEVIPALSKLGCSSGACHGSPNGKNGFRLSLRGYDVEADIQSLIRDEMGRRVDVMEPENSLLLRKPLMQVVHGGGKQMRRSDPGYAILRNWLAHGCSVAEPSATCTGIRFGTGSELLLSSNHDKQQVTVLATFNDGSEKDVTQLAVYSSSDLSVATVTENGAVIGVGRGQAGISARFLEHWSTLFVTFVPSEATKLAVAPSPSKADESKDESQSEIDKLVVQSLEQLGFSPSPLCTDEQFVRRVYLDVIGLLPTISEAQTFLADTDVDKRKKLIDSLLERPEYGRFWALKWGDLLRINKQQVSAIGVQKYNRWLVQAMDSNMPYDEFAKQLLLSQGSTFENPTANYYRTATTVNDATETTAQIFLGVRLECCKCHNHPLEKWTQDNYYGFAAFFNRMQRKTSRRTDEMVIVVADEGEMIQPRTNKPMQPWLPGAGTVEDKSLSDRRETLVDWLTSSDNPFFAAVEANRIWNHVMGRGIVDPVDDFRDSNPPSNPKLLAMLAANFREHGFDRKHILRLILNSHTYQASSVPTPENREDEKYFSHYRTRLLTAEQLLDAIGSFTEQPEKFASLPKGTRATQLPSPDVNIDFLEVFGQPKRETVCQCERISEVTLSQALQISNGELVQEKLVAPEGRLQRLLKSEKSDEQVVEELYLAAFARRPTPQELGTVRTHFEKRKDRELALQDVAWALINSNEFLMQH